MRDQPTGGRQTNRAASRGGTDKLYEELGTRVCTYQLQIGLKSRRYEWTTQIDGRRRLWMCLNLAMRGMGRCWVNMYLRPREEEERVEGGTCRFPPRGFLQHQTFHADHYRSCRCTIRTYIPRSFHQELHLLEPCEICTVGCDASESCTAAHVQATKGCRQNWP
jgi:hypothetical protein